MDSSDDSDDSESRDKVRALGAPDMPNQLAISMIGAKDPYQNYNIGDQALAEADALEAEMNEMFKELDDM